MKIERLPVQSRRGFDCRRDNANCPSCAAGYRGDHGISGGTLWFAVATDYDGQRVALSLEVLGIAYPSTVPQSARRLRGELMSPRGAMLVIHREAAIGGEACDWLSGRPCGSEVAGYLRAGEIYEQHGNRSTDPGTDFTQQSEAFWRALEEQLQAWAAPRDANRGAS